jgi:hypothetical protein
MKNLNKIYPQFLAIIGFVIVSLIYFYPVLQGKKNISVRHCPIHGNGKGAK